jgi:hypothetical protein
MKSLKAILFHLLMILSLPLSLVPGQTSRSMTWESIGPFEAKIQTLLRNPLTGNLIAGTYGVTTAFYRSSDDGASWTKLSEYGNYMYFLVMSKKNPDVLIGIPWYMWFPQSPNNSNRIVKSTDGGVSWSEKVVPASVANTYVISSLRVDPAGTISITGTTYPGQDATIQNSAFELSSSDDGESWVFSKVADLPAGESYANGMATDPSNAARRYIVGRHLVGLIETAIVLRSIDAGKTWVPYTGSTYGGLNNVIIDPGHPNKLYASGNFEMLRSTDGGTTWLEDRSTVGNPLFFDPVNSSTLYTYNLATLFRSTDEGLSWDPIGNFLPHSSINTLIVNPLVPTNFYAGTGNGVYKSTDAGQSWAFAGGSISGADIWAVKCDPSTPERLYVSAYQMGVYVSPDARAQNSSGQSTWQICTNLPVNEIKSMTSKSGNPSKLYVSSQYSLLVGVTSDQASTWVINRLTWYPAAIRSFKDLYAVGWIGSASGLQTMCAARSTDDGATWQRFHISDSLSAGLDIAVDPRNDSIIYVGGYSLNAGVTQSLLMKSTDRGTTWKKVGDDTLSVTGQITTLCIDNSRPDRIFAGTVQGVYLTTDGGAKWVRVVNQPLITSLLINPSNPDFMYASSRKALPYDQVLVSQSMDGGKSWTDIGNGLDGGGVSCLDLDSKNQILYAGTHTQGTFRLSLPVDGNGLPTVATKTHRIALSLGWNMVSSYIAPRDSSMAGVFGRLHTKPTIVKNGAGQIYWPAQNINTIGSWNFRSGYQLFMISADTLEITGTEINPATAPMPLLKGWSLIGYLRNSPMAADSAFQAVGTSWLVKDNLGGAYWQAYKVNTFGLAKPGQAYQVNLSANVVFTYPPNASPAPQSQLSKSVGVSALALPEPSHYRPESISTGVNATVLVEGRNWVDGDEIAIWNTAGLLVGSGIVQRGCAVVTVWGDNPLTEVKDGAVAGELLSMTLWSSWEGCEKQMSMVQIRNVLDAKNEEALSFRPDGVFAVTATMQHSTVPHTFELGQNYPNPFNPATVIRFQLPSSGAVTLKVFDVLGREVATILDGFQQAGTYSIRWDASQLSSGVYIYRLHAGENSALRKMLLMK